MRKVTLLLILVLLLQVQVNAQMHTKQARFTVGIVGGVHVLGKMPEYLNLNDASGLVAGLDLSYSLSKRKDGLSLHFLPHWSKLDRDREEGNSLSSLHIKSEWLAESLNLPFLIRYSFLKGGIRPFIEGGPSLRFRTALSLKSLGYPIPVSINEGFGTYNIRSGPVSLPIETLKTRNVQVTAGIVL